MARQTDLIIGLDVDTREEALGHVSSTEPCQWYKVGSQLYARCGPAVVEELKSLGKHVFLDLKFHDIPNTVKHAARAAADMGAEFFTIHASGGRAMVAAAREGVEGTQARILAVTVLTSLDEAALRDEVGLDESPEEAVARYAAQAVDAGAHGLVCSAKEIGVVRQAVGPEPVLVTPGIRPVWASKDDQARIMTPRQAAEAGSDYIVVVRPILQHSDPSEAARLVLEELDTGTT